MAQSITEAQKKRNEEKRFHFRVGEILALTDAKNTAKALLNRQVHLLYPTGRRGTEEDYERITEKLKTIRLGVEKDGEHILGYKIRKQSEYKELMSRTREEFPGFIPALHSIVQNRSIRIGDAKMKIDQVKSKMDRAVFEIINSYKGNFIQLQDISNDVLKDIPNLQNIVNSKTKKLEFWTIHGLRSYKENEYNELMAFFTEQIIPHFNQELGCIEINPDITAPYFLSTEVIERFNKHCPYKDKTLQKINDKLIEKLNVRMSRFALAYKELQSL